MIITTIKGEKISLHPGVRLEDALLRNLDLAGLDLSESSLRDCFFNESILTGANLRNCDLSGSVFYRTNLIGADLSGSTLYRCYWNEAIYDSSTKWPEGFSMNPGKRALAEATEAPRDQYFPSGLCTPGVIPLSELDIDVPRPTLFVPLTIPTGPISQPSHEVLLLRLAALIYRATHDEEDYGIRLFDRDELYDDEYYSDIVFTEICMSLVATGIRIVSVLDHEHIEATFSPTENMRTFVDTPLFNLFLRLSEALYGEEFDDTPEMENVDSIDTETEYEWLFAEELGLDFDVSDAWTGVDRTVRFSGRPTGTEDARAEVLKTLLHFYFATSQSVVRIPDLTDENRCVSFDKDDPEVPYMVTALALATWHIMGVESISRGPDGNIRAVLKPRIDVGAALREINEDDDVETAETTWSLSGYATRPHAGRFMGHLNSET